MKKILSLVAALIILTPIGYVVWNKDRLFTTAIGTLQDSFAKANAGDYEAATRNLRPSERDRMLQNPEMMKEMWDRVTKKGTIQAVKIMSEIEVRGEDAARIEFVIHYQDGSKVSHVDVVGFEDRRWRHGLNALNTKIADEEFNSLPLPLSDEFTRIEKTRISVRLPQGATWNAKERSFDVPKRGVSVYMIDTPSDATFANLEKGIEKIISLPENKLIERRNLSKENPKSVLFEVDTTKDSVIRRRMYLVIGDKNQAAVLLGSTPMQENFITGVRDCLLSARWDSEGKK